MIRILWLSFLLITIFATACLGPEGLEIPEEEEVMIDTPLQIIITDIRLERVQGVDSQGDPWDSHNNTGPDLYFSYSKNNGGIRYFTDTIYDLETEPMQQTIHFEMQEDIIVDRSVTKFILKLRDYDPENPFNYDSEVARITVWPWGDYTNFLDPDGFFKRSYGFHVAMDYDWVY